MVRGHGAGGRVVLELPDPGGRHATPRTRLRSGSCRCRRTAWSVVRFRLDAAAVGRPPVAAAGGPGAGAAGAGLVRGTASRSSAVLRVTPGAEVLESLARASRTGVVAGPGWRRTRPRASSSPTSGTFDPGDRRRDVNWRASARRRGELRVNDHHPERSTDVVLLLDAFPSAGLADAVRATVSLATAYLGERDRVGLVRFGGRLDWLTPGMGQRAALPDRRRRCSRPRRCTASRGRACAGCRARRCRPAPWSSPSRRSPTRPPSQRSPTSRRTACGWPSSRWPPSPSRRPAPTPARPARVRAVAARARGDPRPAARPRHPGRAVGRQQPLAPVIEEVAAFQRYARHRSG